MATRIDWVSVVIDDVRFEAEAQMIRTLGGRIVHLQRRGVEYRRDHNSEHGITIAEGDLVLSNPGDMAGLRGELVQVLMPTRGIGRARGALGLPNVAAE
jgi:hypothetical protein